MTKDEFRELLKESVRLEVDITGSRWNYGRESVRVLLVSTDDREIILEGEADLPTGT